MQTKTTYAIGIMSGTSLDGVDIVYVRFGKKENYTYEIIHAKTYPYASDWKNRLQQAFTFNSLEIKDLDIAYGTFLGLLVNQFIADYQIENVNFIASHGHTIFHNPSAGFTTQIGAGDIIASICKKKVISDFRSQDVALGGQGAPLVPIGDLLLFATYDYCLNIGGFANISYNKKNIRKAYDICPANIVLNYYTRKIGLEYDHLGKLAKTGKLNQKLLDSLDSLPTYTDKVSLGNEVVQKEFIPLIDAFKLSTPDILHTFTEHFASKIAIELKQGTTLITGGGAKNTYLIERIKKHTNSKIIIPDNQLVDFKEALIFAFLGFLKTENKINCLASVTNASRDHSSGCIFYPKS